MGKIVRQIPEELIGDILRGECVPVVGAGLSLNAILPKGCLMPLWVDLGAQVAKKMKCKPTGNVLKDLSRYCADNSRFDLIRLLWDALHIRTAQPGPVHLEFTKLPFKHVITTNFDFLLERAYYVTGKSCLPVVDEDLMSFGRAVEDTRLIKMHGDLHHPSLMVITEDDYDGFRDQHVRMFQEITNLLIHNTILFIGYSIEDPDFRQIWEIVKRQFGELTRPAYALLVGAADDTINEYQRRGVKRVISLPGSASVYGATLAKIFQGIGREVSERTNNGKKSDLHVKRS